MIFTSQKEQSHEVGHQLTALIKKDEKETGLLTEKIEKPEKLVAGGNRAIVYVLALKSVREHPL